MFRVLKAKRRGNELFQVSQKTLTILIRLNLEIQFTIKISEKTEGRFGVILVPLSSKEML